METTTKTKIIEWVNGRFSVEYFDAKTGHLHLSKSFAKEEDALSFMESLQADVITKAGINL